GWDSFQWSPAFGLSCTGCPNPYAAPTQTTTYTVIAANVAGCTDTAKVTVYVGEIPDSYIPDGTIYFCEGEPLEICLPDVGIPLWIGPNAFVSTERCLSFDNATDAITGNYYAILRTADCRFVKRFRLQPAPRIEVLDISAFQTVCPDEVFTLYVESPQAVSYFWSPAEYLDCPTCPATEGSVPQTATFTVELADSYGCTATDMATVFVDACQARPVLPPSTTQAAEALRFYPNPASGSVQLELPGEGIKTVQLWNSSGMLVRELRTPALAYVLPLQPVPPGTYLLRVVSEDETRAGWLVVSK
ncbi:MAG: T9SS type A sorting domain-containing protein, partial [Phaeodactylibacter sp.]|nr:T9SS type A sorting domain-containing protein [Phaeodactylibacter sp.]